MGLFILQMRLQFHVLRLNGARPAAVRASRRCGARRSPDRACAARRGPPPGWRFYDDGAHLSLSWLFAGRVCLIRDLLTSGWAAFGLRVRICEIR